MDASATNYEIKSQDCEKNIPEMRASITKERLAAFINAIDKLTDYAKIEVGDEGLNCITADPAHVAALKAILPSKSFLSYEAGHGSIGLGIKQVKDVLRFAKKKGDIIDLAIVPDEDWGKLEVIIGGMRRVVSLSDPSRMDIRALRIREPPTNAILKSEALNDFIAQARKVQDWMAIEVTGGGVRLSTHSEANGEVALDIPKDDMLRLHAPESARSLFPMDYMRNIVAALKVDKMVEIEVGTDYPIRMSTVTESIGVELTFWIAPRVE